jgi:hypothetical protein
MILMGITSAASCKSRTHFSSALKSSIQHSSSLPLRSQHDEPKLEQLGLAAHDVE